MAARKSGLGRGLDAIIPIDLPARGYAEVPIDRIRPNPHQPRTRFGEEALEELTASIREVGVLQPVIVRPDDEEGRFVLVAGERRWRAAELAGLTEVPALIRDRADGTANLTEALVENLQREDLSALEEAAAYEQLLADFGMTHEEVATRVGKSRSAVTNTLRLLQLPSAVQGMLDRGELQAGAARALLGLEDERAAVRIAERAVRGGWPVRRVEEAVRARLEGAGRPRGRVRATEPRPAAIIELERRLADQLGSKVKIDYGPKGGKVTVRFADLDDLERIYRHLFG